MIRSLQKKFVVTAMIAVTVLLAVVLGALNIINAVSTTRQAENLLMELVMRSDRNGFQPHGMREDRRNFGFLAEPMGENIEDSSAYFIVRMDERCSVLDVDVSHISSISEEEAEAYALSLDVDSDRGRLDSFRYQIFPAPNGGYSIIFLDNTTRYYGVLRVALLSLLLGIVSWLLMLVLVILLSRRAIRPIAENMERQHQFITDAGHELKTPLAIILANVDAMELRGGSSKYSKNIRTQTERLSLLTQNLLTLARIDETSVIASPEVIDLSALCEENFSMFQESASLKHIDMKMEIEPKVSCRGNAAQIGQLLSILGDNAVKYCPDGGRINVSLSGEDGTALRISNTVSAPVDTDRIFDRFYREDSSRNQKTGGFGIGLSAAQSIARLHNADLSAVYDAEQSVVTFLVRF